MAHAAAPFRARDEDILAAAEIVDIADAATRLEHLHGLAERALGIAARDDHAVHAAAVRLFHDLRNDIALAVVQDLRCAVAPRRLRADRTRADCKQLCRTVQGRARNGHQADGADADDADIIAELHIGQLHAMEARRDHVRQHDGCDRIDIRRQVSHVGIGLVDVEEFGKDAVLEVREFPARQHAAGVHGIARLRFERTPVGRDGRDDDAVAALEVAHERADLNDLTHGLVTEDHVVAVADGALPHGMDVRSAGRDGDGAHNGVQRSAQRAFLFNPTRFSDPKHCVTLHKRPLPSALFDMFISILLYLFGV